MPLCVQCPRSYPRDRFELKDPAGIRLADAELTLAEQVIRLLERTPLLRARGQHRRIQEELNRQRLGATWQCPRGHVMPADFRTVGTVVIGLIGPTATTKSSYLGSLLTQLLDHGILRRLGLSFSLIDEPSKQRWEASYASPLRERRAPFTTLRPDGERQTEPLVVRMTVSRPDQKVENLDLVFFDSAGEVQQNGRDVAIHNPFLHLADAVLLFYTPKALTFEDFRVPGELYSQTAPGPGRVVSTFSTLYNALRLNPAFDGRHPSRDLPVAVVLSKCDELRGLPELDVSDFDGLPLDQSYFARADELHHRLGRLPYEITETYGGAGILQAADALSTQVTYHAVSAMGCEPDEDGTFHDYQPVNVADPLLAVLHALGVIGPTASGPGRRRRG